MNAPVSTPQAASPVVTLDLDVRGLNCPLPILKAKKALNGLKSGEVLRITATDPGSQNDFASFAQQTGHSLLESSTEDKNFVFLLRCK